MWCVWAASKIINHVLKWIKRVSGTNMLTNYNVFPIKIFFLGCSWQAFLPFITSHLFLHSVNALASHLCKWCFPFSLPSPSIREPRISKTEEMHLGREVQNTICLRCKCFHSNANSMNVEQLSAKLDYLSILFNCPHNSAQPHPRHIEIET